MKLGRWTARLLTRLLERNEHPAKRWCSDGPIEHGMRSQQSWLRNPSNPVLSLGVDSSVPLTHHDPRDLVLICSVRKHKISFRILSDLRIQDWIFLKKCTLMLLTEQKSGFGRKRDKKQKIQKMQLTTSSRQKTKTRMTSSWVELTCNKTVFSEPPRFFSEPQIWKSRWPAIFVLCLRYLEYRYLSLFISLREIWRVIYFVVRTYSAIRHTLSWDQISIEQAHFPPKNTAP